MPNERGEFSKEEVSQAIDEMVNAGVSPEDIDNILVDMRAKQPGKRFIWEMPASEQGSRIIGQIASFTGPYLGGVYGAQLSAGRNSLPFLGGAGRAITQFGGEATGIALGDVASRAANAQLEKGIHVPTMAEQNPLESAKLGIGGAALGSTLRGMVQLGGALGHIPESATQGAAEPVRAGKVPLPVPNLRRVARAGPHNVGQIKAGASPEFDLVERAAKAAQKAEQTITQQRLEKIAIIKQADAAGVRIPVAPIQDALREHLITDPGTVTREARTLNLRVQGAIDDLNRVSSQTGGTLSPGQVDKVIRQQLRPKVYSSSGQPSHSMFAAPMADAERSASDLLTQALPGDIATKNAQISQQLSENELAVRLFGDPDKAGVSGRIANAFQPNNEISARALNTLAQHDPSIVNDAFDLYVKRQFAGDIRVPEMRGQAGFYGTFVGKPVELATRGAAPFQRFVGGAASGTYAAMDKKRIRKDKDRIRATRPEANP